MTGVVRIGVNVAECNNTPRTSVLVVIKFALLMGVI